MDSDVSTALFWLGHQLAPNSGTLLRFGDEPHDPDPVFTEADIARMIARADLSTIDPRIVRDSLVESVDMARYWQEQDGVDVVSAFPLVRAALLTVAERIAPVIPRLTAGFTAGQWAVDWRTMDESSPLVAAPAKVLTQWSASVAEDEERSARDRPRDVHANFSGTWWSIPTDLWRTFAEVNDALSLVEDFLGWEVATVIPVRGAGRVLEIDSAEAWAHLCRDFPQDVTHSRRHDWYRVTGRDGDWVIPDWERAAERWDAVHLTTLGYLSAATVQIDLDDTRSSVIAGWAPDCTLWLTDVVREWDEPRQEWHRAQNESTWIRTSPGE